MPNKIPDDFADPDLKQPQFLPKEDSKADLFTTFMVGLVRSGFILILAILCLAGIFGALGLLKRAFVFLMLRYYILDSILAAVAAGPSNEN